MRPKAPSLGAAEQATKRPTFIILLCLTPDDFIRQGESAGTQVINIRIIYMQIFDIMRLFREKKLWLKRLSKESAGWHSPLTSVLTRGFFQNNRIISNICIYIISNICIYIIRILFACMIAYYSKIIHILFAYITGIFFAYYSHIVCILFKYYSHILHVRITTIFKNSYTNLCRSAKL